MHSNRITRSCRKCGAEFQIKPSRLKSNRGSYCSKQCHYTGQSDNPEERFWSKVLKTDSCWLFVNRKGECRKSQYGNFRASHGTTVQSHRYSYELANGPIVGSLYVLHKCDTPACVRPDHLFLGTALDNMHDMIQKGRGKTPPLPHYRGDDHYARTNPEKLARGERCHSAKLTAADVVEIRKRYSSGETKASLSKSYGVKPVSISRVISRRSWKHIP